jgi:hypothetical protein
MFGGATNHQSELASNADRFAKVYDNVDATTEARRASLAEQVDLPMVEVLKRKLAKASSDTASAEDRMPVVATFDLYASVKKYAERMPKDRGIKNATRHLEKIWHADPLGTLDSKSVRGLVATFKDMYPKSKVADVIQAEVSRVGLHKLPVAKLARIAGYINSQHDYDVAMDANGYGGGRVEQIRARAFVRGLVAMRGVDAVVEGTDDRAAFERVADGLADLENGMPGQSADPLDMDMDAEAPMPELDEMQDMAPPPAAPSSPEQEISEAGQMLSNVDEFVQDLAESAPPELQSYLDHELAEGGGVPGTPEWGYSEAEEGHTSPPGTPVWMEEELQELEGMQPGPDMAQSIEAHLLAGRVASLGQARMFINAANEIELWNGTSGVATDLVNMDLAIADFINMATTKRSSPGTLSIQAFVRLPCEQCGEAYTYERSANVADDYACECGNVIHSSRVAELAHVAGANSAKITIKYRGGPNALQALRQIIPTLAPSRHELPGSPGVFQFEIGDDPNRITSDKIRDALQGRGYQVMVQAAEHPEEAVTGEAPEGFEPGGQRLGQMMGVDPEEMKKEELAQSVPTSEAIEAALTNYKAQGMNMLQALDKFLKEHRDRLSNWDDGSDGQTLISMASQLWGSQPTPVQPGPEMDEIMLPPEASLPMTAAKAAPSMKLPAVRKPKDKVAPSLPGADTEQDDSLPSPGKPKSSTGKPKGKLSDTSLGSDTEQDDSLPSPGKIDPRPNQPEGKLSDTNLGPDTEQNDAFKSPKLS